MQNDNIIWTTGVEILCGQSLVFEKQHMYVCVWAQEKKEQVNLKYAASLLLCAEPVAHGLI